MIATVEALAVYRETGYKILADHGIVNPNPEEWYCQQDYCNFLQAVLTRVWPSTIMMIGKTLGMTSQLPPHIDTLEKVLMGMDQFYKLHHRHIPPTAGWRFEKMGPTSLKLISTGPYPGEFLRGVIAGYADKLRPANSEHLSVKIDPAQSRRDTGGDSVKILVDWFGLLFTH